MKIPLAWKLSSNRLLVVMFCLPTVIILIVGMSLILSLLGRSASRLDASELAAERRVIQALVAGLDNSFGKTVEEDSNWDELYDRVSGPLDQQWAKDNLEFSTADAYGLTEVLVIGPDGNVIYSFTAGSGRTEAGDPVDAATMSDLSRAALAAWEPQHLHTLHGVIRYRNQPHLVAIAPIAVTAEKRRAQGLRPSSTLVFLRRVDQSMFSKLGYNFDLAGLRIVPGGNGRLPLPGPTGGPAQFSLDWEDSRLGTEFYRDSLPPIVWVGVAIVGMFVALGFGWAIVIDRMRRTESRAVAAEETSRLKSQFIANMSHELRTPLNAIIGFSELIAGEAFGKTDPQYKEFAGDILSSGNQLLGLVDNILLLSSMEAGQFTATPENLNLNAEITQILRALGSEAARGGIIVKQGAQPSSLSVRTDRQALHQILLNVVANAIKFSTAGGTVHVESLDSAADGCHAIRVVDHGCGIPKSMLHDLGRAFTLAEAGYDRKHQGSGLGLAICFALARRVGVDIAIDSVEGAGTCVTISIPAAANLDAPALPDAALVMCRAQPAAA